MEFSENVNADYTQAKAEVTDKMAKCMKTDGLGGDMWPVNWYDKDGKVLSAPAETFAKWIGVSNTAYAKYTTDTTAASYKTAIDVWNFHARQVSWLKEWLKTNTGKTAPDATVLKTYTDKLVSAPADAAGTIAKLAPEKPEVPPMPASYNGPALKPKDTKDADRKDMFELIGGMGRPSIGKLIVKDALGTQHMFGVKGTGNTATNANADVKKDPNAVSLLYPAQDSDTTKCKPSTLVVIVRGTKAQTKVGNKVTLSFKKEAFATNPLVLNAKPTETTLKPLDREAASYIATGLATVALVAASLYWADIWMEKISFILL